MTKPSSPTELVLRVRSVLHRAGTGAAEPDGASYGSGWLRIDPSRHEAALSGERLDLTPTEWGLLTTMAAIPGRVYSRYELVNRVRGYERTCRTCSSGCGAAAAVASSLARASGWRWCGSS